MPHWRPHYSCHLACGKAHFVAFCHTHGIVWILRFQKLQEFFWGVYSLYGVCKRHMIRRQITANIIINTSKIYLRKALLFLISRLTRLKKEFIRKNYENLKNVRIIFILLYTALIYLCLSVTKMEYCHTPPSPPL